MSAYLWIAVGAVFGAAARYHLSRLLARLLSSDFPYGTLLVNVAGSFIVGFLLVWTTERVLADPRWRLLLVIGFCGSFTTFSSYAFETFVYLEQGHWWLLASNFFLNNAGSLLAVIGGAALARGL